MTSSEPNSAWNARKRSSSPGPVGIMDSTPGSVRRPSANQPNSTVRSAMTAKAGVRHATRNETPEPVTSLRRGREIDMKHHGVFVLDGAQRGAVWLVPEAALRKFNRRGRVKHIYIHPHRCRKLHGTGERADRQRPCAKVTARRLTSDYVA